MHTQIGLGLADQLLDMAAHGTLSPDHARGESHSGIFKELAFTRLTESWRLSDRDAGRRRRLAFDHKVFRQFELAHASEVTLDFWFRGFYISPSAGRAFFETLRYAHPLTDYELTNLAEVLGVVGVGLGQTAGHEPVSRIICAEVGALNGRRVLAVRWEHLKLGRIFSSLFIDADGDGRTVHEIHFSAPAAAFERHIGSAHELFRSIQWLSAPFQPISGCA